MESYLLLLIIPAFVVLFVGMWSLVALLIAHIGGWATLARHYRVANTASVATKRLGPRLYLGFAELNGSRYQGVLAADVTKEGLFLSVLPLFRPGHPPLLIPWSQISVFQTENKRWRVAYTATILAGDTAVYLTLFNKLLADAIESARQSVADSGSQPRLAR